MKVYDAACNTIATVSSSIASPVPIYRDLFNDNRKTMAQHLYVVSSTVLDLGCRAKNEPFLSRACGSPKKLHVNGSCIVLRIQCNI